MMEGAERDLGNIKPKKKFRNKLTENCLFDSVPFLNTMSKNFRYSTADELGCHDWQIKKRK